jgi:eukaryotic-like serine/threonine-protein kinase
MSAADSKLKPTPHDSPIEPGDVVAGKYRVQGTIAVGGMGQVVAAEHVGLAQEVAIKVLLPSELEQEPHSATRFLREARAAAGLESEHVVRIFDVDTLPSGLPYMVMERLVGDDLRALLRARGPLPIADVVEYVTQACRALGEAHALGIVHRDLKPSNLFLVRRKDGSTLVKVLDFGISKGARVESLEGTLTTSQTLIGSPLYMSPEQIRDPKNVDARSDIWSLGVILHQLLTGRPVFSGESLAAVCAAIAADPPARTRELRPDVPPELEAVIARCLAKRPGARFQNVGELCAALAPFGRPAVSGSGLWARPSSPESSDAGPGGELPTALLHKTPRLSDAPLAASRTRTLDQTRSKRSRWRLIALGASVVLLGSTLGLVVARALRGADPAPTPPAAAASEPEPAAPAALPSEAPAEPVLASPDELAPEPLPPPSAAAKRIKPIPPKPSSKPPRSDIFLER